MNQSAGIMKRRASGYLNDLTRDGPFELRFTDTCDGCWHRRSCMRVWKQVIVVVPSSVNVLPNAHLLFNS